MAAMPSTQITIAPMSLDDADDLFVLFKELVELGWFGSGVGFSADDPMNRPGQTDPQVPTWTLFAHFPDPTAPGGARTLRADVGDIRVDVNGTFSEVLTPDAYAAKYGSN